MTRWKIWLCIAIVFFSGIGIGILGTVYGTHCYINSMVEEGPVAFNKMVAKHISSHLDLDEEQSGAMFNIVTKTHHKLWEFKTKHNDKIAEIIQKGFDEMKSHLSVEKQQELQKLHDKFHETLHSHMTSDK